MDSATENDVDTANVTFVVDKTKIKVSSLVEKCPQLADLGLTVYSQDVFEEAVLDQIDEACKNLSEVRDSRLDGESEAKNDKSSGNSFSTSQFENATVSSVNKSLLFDESNDLIRLGEATPFEVFAKSEFRCKDGRTQGKSVTVFSEDEEIVKSDVCEDACRSGSDEEYKPSSSDEVEEMNTDGDIECDEPLPKKQKLESKTSKKKVKKTTKLAVKAIKKCQDDGSDEHFEIRLKAHKKVKLRKASDRLERTGSLDEPDDDIQLKGGLLIPAELWKKLFKYQRTGVRWLWELHRQSVGGIMGDEMGLGKTIQLIAFLGSLSRSKLHNDGFGFSGLGATLIVCPTTVMHQWVKEMHNWWPEFRVAILHDSGSYGGPRHRLISKIHSVNGVLITSYSTLTNERQTLVKYDWHYVILDEGHKIRNPDAQVTLAVKQFRTPHRLILTGTPMQNSLKELWSIFDFVFPGRLGALPDFIREFGIPITQGGYANASPVQVETAYKCACVLREAISPYLLRRTKADVKTTVNLPSKSEQVLFCRLTEHQRNVYKQYLTSRECDAILKGRLEPFVGLISLRKLCNHPDLVTGGPNRLGDLDESQDPSVTYGYWPRSGKMVVVEALLKLWKEQNHRVLLFSQSRQMLNIMEKFVKSEKYSYLRMDGSTAIGSRQGLVARFNEDSSLFCLLLTTRVGGLGLNLIGADRILIYDPDWNPSTDIQARERAWRIGQTRPVTVYRLLLAGTIEEKIYHRQIFKQFLTNRILKDPKQRRFFKTNDLFELFTLSDDRNAKGTETSVLFAGTGSEIQISTSSKSAKNIEKHKSKNIFDEIANEKGKIYLNPPNTVEDEEDIDFVPKVIISADTESTCDKISVEPSSSDVVEEKNSKSQRLRELAKKLSQQLANCKEEQESSVKKRSKRKRKKCKLDGVVIPNLAKTTDYKPGLKDDDSRTSEELSQKQDDYVLNRLFKKSNIHSALKHDKVVDSGEADSTLVQAEADSVARRAVKSLVDSRRRCHSAYSGIPTWTGKHGSLAPRFGNVSSFRRKTSFSATKKKAKKSTPNKTQSLFGGSDLLATTNVATCDQPLHSNDLLSLIKNKNQFRRCNNADSDDEEERHSSEVVVPPPVVSKSKSLPAVENSGSRYDGILAELRNFIAFGAKVDGRAETEEILTRFGSRVALQDSAVFKSLLQKICDFNRTVNGNGVWVLKTQFR